MRIPTIDIPIFDNAFEIHIELESTLPANHYLALYIKDKKATENIVCPNSTGTDEQKLQWDTYFSEEETEKGTELPFIIDGVSLYEIAGVIKKKYYLQFALYDGQADKRLETVQPGKIRLVSEIKQ